MVNYDWLEPLDCDESLSIIKELALAHAQKGGEQGERIASCITSGDLSALCNYRLDYEASGSIWELSNCRQALAFFSKLEFIEIGVDRRAAAVKTWWDAEHLCKQTNELFEALEAGSVCIDPVVSAVLHRATRKISLVLGDVPTFAQMAYRFGPGGTTLTKKREASVVEKLHAGISCSEELLPYASRILAELPHLCDLHKTTDDKDLSVPVTLVAKSDRSTMEDFRIRVRTEVQPDRLNFVLKNAKTYRSVTSVSSLTMMCQLALGGHMTDRLGAFGIDLRNQTLNREWAQVGSIDGSVATLDLSSASDTIASRLVCHLLPYEWVIALNACRSSKVELDGEIVVQEKFASMGNGFTFPLESLIFWALASSASETGWASVYGDDIIVETEAVPLVMQVLKTCGFLVNSDKSYWAGSFRESCGADYHSGIDIRPYYQTALISGMELFKLHNYYERRGNTEMRLRVKAHIHPWHCIYGPDNYGDGHLLGAYRHTRHKKRDSHGYGGVIFDTYKLTSRRDGREKRAGDSVLPLYAIYRRETGDSFVEGVGEQEGLIAYLRIARFAPEPLPERAVQRTDGTFDYVKMPTYPGTDGYKKVSMYTFNP